MIKTFEQFVSTMYGKPINEGFQSNKLRTIIKQHGLPKNYWDKKMLYDLKDDEIIDVVNSRDEYHKYRENYDGHKEIFIIELEDGACIIIGNFNILKSYISLSNSDKEKDELFKKRHAKRHLGNLGKNGGDDIHKKHLEKVSEIERKRFAAKLQPNIQEFVDAIESNMDELDSSYMDDEGEHSMEFEINVDDIDYTIYVEYTVRFTNDRKEYGAYFHDVEYTLDSFNIENEDGEFATNEDIGITYSTHKDLFKDYTIEDVEDGIYDYYAYYGVSRADFY